MQKLSTEFYHTAIKTEFPDAENITLPTIPGKVARVFIFQTQNGPRVCRFNDGPIIMRNYKFTHELYNFGAPIKPTRPHVYLGQYFESYEYDPHPTLRETIKIMSPSEINDTYKSALCIQAQLASFPTKCFDDKQFGTRFMDVYNMTMPHCVNNGVMRYLYRALYKHFSGGNQMYIMHTDLTPSNMLISDDKRNIVRLIDFDAISICNENLAIFGMLRCYPLDDINGFIEYYQDISGHILNHREITRMLNLFKKTLNIRLQANKFSFNKITKRH